MITSVKSTSALLNIRLKAINTKICLERASRMKHDKDLLFWTFHSISFIYHHLGNGLSQEIQSGGEGSLVVMELWAGGGKKSLPYTCIRGCGITHLHFCFLCTSLHTDIYYYLSPIKKIVEQEE